MPNVQDHQSGASTFIRLRKCRSSVGFALIPPYLGPGECSNSPGWVKILSKIWKSGRTLEILNLESESANLGKYKELRNYITSLQQASTHGINFCYLKRPSLVFVDPELVIWLIASAENNLTE